MQSPWTSLACIIAFFALVFALGNGINGEHSFYTSPNDNVIVIKHVRWWGLSKADYWLRWNGRWQATRAKDGSPIQWVDADAILPDRLIGH